jgi:hypothetical protein
MSVMVKGGYASGHDMWEDHKNQYGIITARIMCVRYLDMQARSKDPEEREFCRQLREALDMKRNMKDSPYYKQSFEYALSHGEEALYNDSDFANERCAGDIDGAIRACEYGDGSHKPEPAVRALIDHYGAERLSFALALEVRRDRGSFSAENRAWADSFDIQSGFPGRGVTTHAEVLDEFIACFRETIDKARGTELSAPAIEVFKPSESERNFAAWMAVTERSRCRWTEDEIYRLNGRGAMYYTGGEDGVYLRIRKDGVLEAGNYEWAIPHIGEAFFKPVVTQQFNSFGDAYTRAMEAGGKRFMADMFSGADPQPLIKITGEPEEKPSVLKQIRATREAPKPPRAEKLPKQRNRKSDIER